MEQCSEEPYVDRRDEVGTIDRTQIGCLKRTVVASRFTKRKSCGWTQARLERAGPLLFPVPRGQPASSESLERVTKANLSSLSLSLDTRCVLFLLFFAIRWVSLGNVVSNESSGRGELRVQSQERVVPGRLPPLASRGGAGRRGKRFSARNQSALPKLSHVSSDPFLMKRTSRCRGESCAALALSRDLYASLRLKHRSIELPMPMENIAKHSPCARCSKTLDARSGVGNAVSFGTWSRRVETRDRRVFFETHSCWSRAISETPSTVPNRPLYTCTRDRASRGGSSATTEVSSKIPGFEFSETRVVGDWCVMAIEGCSRELERARRWSVALQNTLRLVAKSERLWKLETFRYSSVKKREQETVVGRGSRGGGFTFVKSRFSDQIAQAPMRLCVHCRAVGYCSRFCTPAHTDAPLFFKGTLEKKRKRGATQGVPEQALESDAPTAVRNESKARADDIFKRFIYGNTSRICSRLSQRERIFTQKESFSHKE